MAREAYGVSLAWYEPMVRQRVRIRFSKSGNLKYIGHKDLLRTLEALFRRARLPLALSGGFHPKVRMSFPSALALGVDGFDEVLELEMSESVDAVDSDAVLADLNRCTVDGLRFLQASTLPEGSKKARLVSSVFVMTIPDELRKMTTRHVATFRNEVSLVVEKSNGRSVDVRDAVEAIVFDENSGSLTVEIRAQEGPEAGIRELLPALGLGDTLFQSVFPTRLRCRLAEDSAKKGSLEDSRT